MRTFVEGAEGVLPHATQDSIDRCVVSIFLKYEWVITSERWVRNPVFDKRGAKTSWVWKAQAIRTDAEAQRMADRYNAISAAHPDWKLPRIKSVELEPLPSEAR